MPNLSFRNLWTASIVVYKAQYRLFLSLALIALIIDLPWTVYNYLTQAAPTSAYSLFNFISSILSLLYGIWILIAITQVVAKHAHDERVSIWQTLEEPRRAFGRVLAVLLLSILILAIPVGGWALIMIVISTVVRVAAGTEANRIFLSFLPLMLFLPLIFLVTLVYFAPTGAVIDGGVFQAVKRGLDLTRGRFWRTFGMLLLLSSMTQGLPIIVDALQTFNVIKVSFNLGLLINTGMAIYGNLVFPLTVTFTTLMYLRMRD